MIIDIYLKLIMKSLDLFCKWINGALSIYHSRKIKGSSLKLEFPCEITNHEFIIAQNFSARRGLRINLLTEHFHKLGIPSLIVGTGTRFEFNVHIGVINKVEIGSNVLVGSNVIIIDHNHGQYSDGMPEAEFDTPPFYRRLTSKGQIYIGNNVWIGDGAIILSGAHIGSGSVIGANAVVSGDVPENSIIVGPKSIVIRYYDMISCCWRNIDSDSRKTK
jgi:acetyltransferase-like isoleucine patch superfamily enzyme